MVLASWRVLHENCRLQLSEIMKMSKLSATGSVGGDAAGNAEGVDAARDVKASTRDVVTWLKLKGEHKRTAQDAMLQESEQTKEEMRSQQGQSNNKHNMLEMTS